MTSTDLLAKYDVPVPRYTSYPTVPQWHRSPSRTEWIEALGRAADAPDAALALYLHIPFCRSLCTFCGCNNVITRDTARGPAYVDDLLAELDLYLAAVPVLGGQVVRQIHLGGGTPTFLSPESLARLVDGIGSRLGTRGDAFEGALEVDPRVTSEAQLEVLRARGFQRVSLGVQDVDPDVQFLINRDQPIDETRRVVAAARTLGYDSINLDLIYGLPGQTEHGIRALADEVEVLNPDRLAVYSFAKVPWIKPQQRRFNDEDLPSGAAKLRLFEILRSRLIEAGYVEIGMDHFARPGDALARAADAGTLHRNFMGYTDVRTTTLLGLGVSAISETPDCYHQNAKVLTRYESQVRAGTIPTLRGHLLSHDDRERRAAILALMTRFQAPFSAGSVPAPAVDSLAADGIVRLEDGMLRVPAEGRAFLRNAAALFDAYLPAQAGTTPIYSRSV